MCFSNSLFIKPLSSNACYNSLIYGSHRRISLKNFHKVSFCTILTLHFLFLVKIISVLKNSKKNM